MILEDFDFGSSWRVPLTVYIIAITNTLIKMWSKKKTFLHNFVRFILFSSINVFFLNAKNKKALHQVSNYLEILNHINLIRQMKKIIGFNLQIIFDCAESKTILICEM